MTTNDAPAADRQETSRQREDLKDQLISKYMDRFGAAAADKPGDQNGLGASTIRNEVNKFIEAGARMSDANISRLERRLQRHAKGLPVREPDVASQRSVSGFTAGSGSLTARGVANATPPQPCKGSLTAREAGAGPAALSVGDAAYATPRAEGPVTDAPANQASLLEWVSGKLANKLMKQDALRNKQHQTELQQRLKNDLEKQMEDKHMRRKLERDERRGQPMREEDQRFPEDESAKEKARRDMVVLERAQQMQQIELNRQRKVDEKARIKKEAEAIIKKADLEMKAEKEKTEEKLTKQRIAMQEALTASSNSQKLRDDTEKARALREAKELAEYQRMQEMRDQDARDKSAKKQADRDVIASEQASRVNNDKERDRELEAAVQAERAEKDRLAAEKEKTERMQRKKTRMETQEFLRQQIEQKRQTKIDEASKRREVRVLQEADLNNFEAAERQKRADKRQQLIAYSKELEQQVAARTPTVSRRDAASDEEEEC